MEMAVERNNQTRRFITFLRRLFFIKTSQVSNETQSVNINDEFHLSDIH